MIEKIKLLLNRYREIIVYVIVGFMTTMVNWLSYYLLTFVLDSNIPWQLSLNNTISWIVAVVFAYPLNRRWVFRSDNPHVFREFCGFTASRVSTWIIELFLMWLCVSILKINQFISKYIIAAVLVVILNYVFSKLFIFRKKQAEPKSDV